MSVRFFRYAGAGSRASPSFPGLLQLLSYHVEFINNVYFKPSATVPNIGGETGEPLNKSPFSSEKCLLKRVTVALNCWAPLWAIQRCTHPPFQNNRIAIFQQDVRKKCSRLAKLKKTTNNSQKQKDRKKKSLANRPPLRVTMDLRKILCDALQVKHNTILTTGC